MDSEAPADGYLLDIVDNNWREEKLPFDLITVPTDKLPDPEADGGDSHLTLCEQEQKWTDLALTCMTPDILLNEQANAGNI